MRNVNEEKKELDKRESDCFILTMRNVNTAQDFLNEEKEYRFILTMRNVNMFSKRCSGQCSYVLS